MSTGIDRASRCLSLTMRLHFARMRQVDRSIDIEPHALCERKVVAEIDGAGDPAHIGLP